MTRLIVVGAVSDRTGRMERWRGVVDGSELMVDVAKRACGDQFTVFRIGKVFKEAEYTKEKEREALKRLGFKLGL
jgi:hypothetical protein